MNNCDPFRKQLLELDVLHVIPGSKLAQHLNDCEACKNYYQELLALQQHIDDLPAADVADEVFAKTLAAVHAAGPNTAAQSTVPTKRQGINQQWATGLAASFVMVAVAGLLYNGSISEFEAEFNPVPNTLEPLNESTNAENSERPLGERDLEFRARTQNEKMTQTQFQPSEQSITEDDMSLARVPEEDMDGYRQDLEPVKVTGARSRRMPAKPQAEAPHKVGDTLGELLAAEPSGMIAPEKNDFADTTNDLSAVADQVMDHGILMSPIITNESYGGQPSDTSSTDKRVVENQPKQEMNLDQLRSLVKQDHAVGNDQKVQAQLKLKKSLSAKDDDKPKNPRLKNHNKAFEVNHVDRPGNLAGAGVKRTAEASREEGVGIAPEYHAVLESTRDNVAAEKAKQYLSELQVTENLAFKVATGYWANTYVPGDANMRWLQAGVQQAGGLGLPSVRQNPQPFDAPNNAALALYLSSDHQALNATGPTRMRLQVGLQAGEHQGGHRSALNLAVVLDLGQNSVHASGHAEVEALLTALLKNKQSADQISVYLTGSQGGQILAAKDFKHGPIQVAIGNLKAQPTRTESADLLSTVQAANGWLKSQDDPSAVLGSSAVLLVSGKPTTNSMPSLESWVQQQAIDGITFSTLALGEVGHRDALDRLALMGQGHSRVMAGVEDAERVIQAELKSASRAVARALRLQIRLADGVQLIDVLGSHSLNEIQSQQVRAAEQSLDQRMSKNLGIAADRGRDEDGIQMVIPSYFAGDTHVILLDVLVDQPGVVAEVSAKYKDLVYLRNASSSQSLQLSKGQNNWGPLELNVMKNVLAHRLVQTINQAAAKLRQGDHSESIRSLQSMLELLQGMRQHIQAWHEDSAIQQDEKLLKQYLQLLNSQSSIDPSRYQLIADSMRLIGWQRLLSHSP